jgi:phosphatidylinositol 4-kinase
LGIFPSKSGDIRNFSFAQSIYVLSVYHLEMLRAKRSCALGIFNYLADEALQNSLMLGILEAISNEVSISCSF